MGCVILDITQSGDVEKPVDDMIESTQPREALTGHRDELIIIGSQPL